MRCVLLGSILLLLATGVGFASQGRNTISQAYDEAFANPKGFDAYVLFEVDDSFYAKFAKCAQGATPILAAVEKNLRQSYGTCRENSECVAIAKDIAVVAEARENIRALAAYFDALRRDDDLEFAESEAGRRALIPFETMKKVLNINDDQGTALIRQTPAFQGVMKILWAVPCQ